MACVRSTVNQSKLESSIEATANIAVGFIVSFSVYAWLVPVIWPKGVPAEPSTQVFWLTCIFTVSSWLRSYLWRRFFNAGMHKVAQRMARRLRGVT